MTHTSPAAYRVNLRVSFPVSCHSGELTRLLESARSGQWVNSRFTAAIAPKPPFMVEQLLAIFGTNRSFGNLISLRESI